MSAISHIESSRRAFEQWLPTIKGGRPDIQRWPGIGPDGGFTNDATYRHGETDQLWRAWLNGYLLAELNATCAKLRREPEWVFDNELCAAYEGAGHCAEETA